MSGDEIEDELEKLAQARVEALRQTFVAAAQELKWSDEPAPVFQPDLLQPDGHTQAA